MVNIVLFGAGEIDMKIRNFFGKYFGVEEKLSADQMNEESIKHTIGGLSAMNSLLSSPDTIFYTKKHKALGTVFEARRPDGNGARWTEGQKKFLGFLAK
jgi:hypothetical protein